MPEEVTLVDCGGGLLDVCCVSVVVELVQPDTSEPANTERAAVQTSLLSVLVFIITFIDSLNQYEFTRILDYCYRYGNTNVKSVV